MSNKEDLTLEDLKRLKEQLIQDLSELRNEEEFVANAVSSQIVQELLQNRNEIPKHSRMLLKAQNKRIADNVQIKNGKLIDYYETVTGVTVNNISLKSLPLTEDPTDKCCYQYEVDANIENLHFNISYCTNQPPDLPPQNKYIIKNLKISLARQIEIQEGLDFFAEKHPNIPMVILFLKSVNKLRKIRYDICKSLLAEYKSSINIATIEATEQICIICKGTVNPNDYFVIYWQIKWNDKTYHSARDSFKIDAKITDKQLFADTKPVFEDICSHEKWSTCTEKEKLQLFLSAASLRMEAENRNLTTDSNATITEYSSIG